MPYWVGDASLVEADMVPTLLLPLPKRVSGHE
jgi:hypothetical protein